MPTDTVEAATPAALPHTADPGSVFETRPADVLVRIALAVWQTRVIRYRSRPYVVNLVRADLEADPGTAAIADQLARHGAPWVHVNVLG